METFGNEIKVQQGEDFNIDILLSSNQIEYIPYIISNERKNPFFVVTVASTRRICGTCAHGGMIYCPDRTRYLPSIRLLRTT